MSARENDTRDLHATRRAATAAGTEAADMHEGVNAQEAAPRAPRGERLRAAASRMRRGARIALVVVLTYVLATSNILSPLGIAIARAYATGTPLLSPAAEQPAPAAEDAPQQDVASGADGEQDADGADAPAHEDAAPADTPETPADKNQMGGGTSGDTTSGEQTGADKENAPINDAHADKDASKDAAGKDDVDDDNQAESDPASEPAEDDEATPAAEGGPEYQLPDTSNPNGEITKEQIYPKLVLSGKPTPGSDFEYLVRAGEEPDLTIDFNLGSTDASYGRTPDRLLTLVLQVPYLVHDKTNPEIIKTTLSKDEWEQDGSGMRLAIIPELGSGWTYYENGKRIQNAAEAKDGLSGEIIMQYTNDGGAFKQGKGLPKQKVMFVGPVPENVGAAVNVGLWCTYKKGENQEINGNLHIDPTMNPGEYPSAPRRVTFINTNLDWEQKIEVVNQPVLWDRYNYMVYRVTLTNMSKTKESAIKRFEFSLEAEPEEPLKKHILQSDIAAWELNEQGEIVPHDHTHDPNDRSHRLIGVPGQGGVLLYDITEASPEKLDELDTDRFSNAEELGFTPLEYKSLMDGYINFEGDYELVSKGESQAGRAGEQGSAGDHRTYLVALPYTTNLQGVGNEPPRVGLKSIASVKFGQNGEYSWSKEQTISAAFQNPVVAFTQSKRAKDLETGTLAASANGYLGWMGTYVIDGFSTAGGNIPIFGPTSNDPAVAASGPHVIDTVPEHFALRNIEFQTKVPTARDVPLREVDRYFDTTHGPIEVELKGTGDEESTWVKLDMPLTQVDNETSGVDTFMTWRVGVASEDYEGSVAQGIDNLAAAHGKAFTGRVRFLLADEIPANKDLPVRIKVNGLLDAPQTEFKNTVQTEYGQRHWNTATAESPQGHYTVNKRTSAASSAKYVPVIEPEPQVNAVAHGLLPDGTNREGGDVTLPLSLPNAGWRFELRNNSPSKMQPATFETSTVNSSYLIDKITLSKALLEQATIESVAIQATGQDPEKPKVLTGEEVLKLVDPATGDAVIANANWSGRLQKVQVRFSSFNNNVGATHKAYIDLTGVSKNVQNYSLSGTFSTAYDKPFDDKNKKDSDSAIIRVQPSVPTIDAVGHTKVEADPQETIGKDINIPLSAGVSGWRFMLGNASDTKMEPARFYTGTLPLEDKGGKLYGFQFDTVTLSAELLAHSQISAIKLHVQEQQEPIVVTPEQLEGVTAAEDGSKALARDEFWADRHLRGVTVEFDSVDGQLDKAKAFIDLAGQSNYMQKAYTLKGTFTTAYPDGYEGAQASDEDEATLRTQAANPGLQVAPHGDLGVTSKTASATLEVPGAGWKFIVKNDSTSAMAPARFSTSVLPHATLNNKEYGFEVEQLVLSGALMKASDIRELTVTVAGGDPVTISGDEIEKLKPEADGSVVIPASMWGGKLLESIVLDFDRVGENLTGTDASIDIQGRATKYDDFTLSGKFETRYGNGFPEKSASDTGKIHVVPPQVTLHTHGQYVDVREVTESYNNSTDGSHTQIAVPYDRDFELWADVSNKTAMPLRDVDLTFALPLAWEKDIKQEGGALGEAWTGFHTTGITLSPAFLNAWGKHGEIHLYDAETVRDKGAADLVLKPAKDGGFVTDDGKLELKPGADGAVAISEQQLIDAGIDNLKQVEFIGWKNLKVDDAATDETLQRVTFAGFSDTALGKADQLIATADNFYTGVRPAGRRNPLRTAGGVDYVHSEVFDLVHEATMVAAAAADGDWVLTSRDYTDVYMSKMFFDASARAGFYDEDTTGAQGSRFTVASTPHDDGHYNKDTSTSIYMQPAENNEQLEVGYKAIGSYLFDFRQYLNAYNQPTEKASYLEQRDVAGNYKTLLSGKTYNTGAELSVTQDIPEDFFDSYYIKVRPEAVDHIKAITVNYTEGGSKTTTPDEWATTENALEDVDGTKFFRIDLLGEELSFPDGAQKAPGRDGIADYGDNAYTNGVPNLRRVKSITYTLRINQNQYTDDTKTTAGVPDYGMAYKHDDNGQTAGIEVTGRFVGKPDTTFDSKTRVDMLIGGDYSGNTRTGAKAAVRYKPASDADNTERSDWSYLDFTVYDQTLKSSHVVSNAQTRIDRDEQYVLKGVHDTPKLDWEKYREVIDGDTTVRFGSDQRFSTTFYRENKDGGDWGSGRVGFSDHTLLTDKLPVIEWDTTANEYYGFLATGVRIAKVTDPQGNNQVMDKLESITFTIKDLDDKVPERTVTVPRADLEDIIAANNGEIYVGAAPKGQTQAPELAGKTVYDLNLGPREALTKYEVRLSGMGGDVDGSREIDQVHQPERSNGKTTIDAQVFGRPYAYGNQRPTTSTDVLNAFTATSSLSSAPNSFSESAEDYTSDRHGKILYDHASDKAYFMGYLIPFATRASLWLPDGQDAYLYDYAPDNNAPNTAAIQVKYQNRPDAHAGQDDSSRSARVSGATLAVDLSTGSDDADMYRLRNVYIPKEFVSSKLGGTANWFEASFVRIKAGNTIWNPSLDTLQGMGVFGPSAEDPDLFVVDIEKLMRDDLLAGDAGRSLVAEYGGRTSTNTLNGFAGDAEFDLQYARPFVKEVAVHFEAIAPDIDDAATTLAGGEWLSPSKGQDDYAFSYDGIYVDRSMEDFKTATDQGDKWNSASTPSFGKQANAHGIDVRNRHTVSVESPKSVDPNAQSHYVYGGTGSITADFYVTNLAARADVQVTRGKKVELNGKDDATVFAYDRDEASMTSPESYDPAAKDAFGNNIPNGMLMAGDYIDYTVQIDAAMANAMPGGVPTKVALPLEHTQARFEAPKGQRIIGWEILDNRTGIPDSQITAQFEEAGDEDKDGASGRLQDALPQTDYSLTADGAESYIYNRNLVVTLGELDKAKPDAVQIQPGEGVTLRVITQMTDELETDQDYQDKNNEAFKADAPSYQDAPVVAHVKVLTRPKHGYVQQRFITNSGSGSGELVHRYDTDVDNTSSIERNRVDYDAALDVSALAGGPDQFGLDVESHVRFYNHSSATGSNVGIKAAFTNTFEDGNKAPEANDGSDVEVTVSGIENPSRHTQDMTVTVDFTKEVGSGDDARPVPVFQLMKAPQPKYPAGIPAPAQGTRPDVLVEYWDTTANNGAGAWVEEKDLKLQKLPTSGEEAEGYVAEAARANPLEALAGLFAADPIDPVGPSEALRAQESKFHFVTAVRWTYFDVPATSDGAASYKLDDVKLTGVGRYADTRDDASNDEMADSFTGRLRVDLGLTHTHDENTAIDFATPSPAQNHKARKVKHDEGSQTSLTVYRSAPNFTFQTQTFQTEAQAAEKWNASAPQKTGYVPGESFWYKDSMTNMAGGTNPAAPNLEGEAYNPVIYERIPSRYLVNADGTPFKLEAGNVRVAWYDQSGDPVPGAKVASVERVEDAKAGVETGEAPDFGGSMNYDSDVQRSMSGRGWNDKGMFSDMDPTAEGVSNTTTFDLYRISFTNDAATAGEPVFMKPGDRIEIWFEATAATDGLPQVYQDTDENLGTSADQSPAYFPRIGEYATTTESNYHFANPINSASGDGFGANWDNGVAADKPVKVNNGNVLMDMDALLHDAACSADKPEQSDLWEAFDASRTYIPGSSFTVSYSTSTYGQSGQNRVYLDEDVKTGKYQQVQYVPRKATGATAPASRAQLPGDTFLVTPNSTLANGSQSTDYHRDYAQFVTSPRTRGDIGNLERRWGSKAPLVWGESSLHLQKAWLASASDIEPNTGDYKAERQYEGSDYSSVAYDPHYLPWGDGPGVTTEADLVRAQDGVVLNKYAAALEYNQDFTAQLQALNYGDRNLDGVEMLYVMPRGVEPKLPVGVNPKEGEILGGEVLGASAHIRTSIDGVSGATTDAVINESYQDISSYMTVQVVQTPYGADKGYRAPSDPQDPGRYREGAELASGKTDLSRDPAASSYQAVASPSDDRTGREYAESSQPWVLKITVRHPLAKWYGRNIDTGEANTADTDGWTGDAGYKLRVDVPAHVFANNASGTWNDRLLVTPWDDPAAAAPSPASSYFSVMDVDHNEGTNYQATAMNDMQVYGMDYMWSLPSWYNSGTPDEWELKASSPNMPSVNGYTVLNNSVLGEGGAAGAVGDRNAVRYDKANKDGQRLWAQTGTRAVMRKPMVRTWNTVGDDGVTGDVDEYYFDAEYDSAQMNVHVENRYWWDDYAIQYESYATGTPANMFEKAVDNYSVDGGQKGDLVLPVVTTVLPENVAPIDAEGDPYPTDGKAHALTNWSLSRGTAEDYAKDPNALAGDDPAAKSRFTATATYEEVSLTGGEPAMRYVVRFTANDPSAWNVPEGTTAGGNIEARIPSGGMDTFKFRIATVGAPAYDAEHPETGRSYENAHTFVSSKLPGTQVLTDADIIENHADPSKPFEHPYKVGSKAQLDRIHTYKSFGASSDIRLDAVQDSKTYGSGSNTTTLTGGVIPSNEIDDGPDTVLGARQNALPGSMYRYVEQDKTRATPNIEGYTFRPDLHLNEDVAAGLDGDATVVHTDAFARADGVADATLDAGAMSTLKLRVAKPRLVAEHTVAFDPSMDVPSLEDDDRMREPGMPEAAQDQAIGRDGKTSPVTTGNDGPQATSEPLQYGDTPWLRATIKNDPDGKLDQTGAILHGKLVFAVHLPSQVSFYDKQKLTDGTFTADDAGRFYVEWTHFDRAAGKSVTEQLTPKDMVESGWHVHVSEAPDWGANDFTQPDYAKPDRDDPDNVGTDPTAKPKQREGETLVFEFAPPHDATPEEFDRYATLAAAVRSGVRPDGYLGSGDSLTLHVKTRVDNLGAEDDAGTTTDWLADASEFYGTVHDLDGRDWEGDDVPEDAWISTWRNPAGGADKPVFPADSDNFFDQGFAEQLLETIVFANEVTDAPATTALKLDIPPVEQTPARDFDCDGDYTDVYTHATSGTFRLAKPKSSVRIDTKTHRVLVTNPDLGDEAADDASLGEEQVLLLDQAVNEGGAVNSMIVDWDIPYYGTTETSPNPPSLSDSYFDSLVSEVSTGVWEIPGASMAEDATDGERALAEYEQRLRVFMLARVEPTTGTPEAGTVGGNVDYHRPGTAADRTHYEQGGWRVIGSQTGYPVRGADGSKVNTTIKLYDAATAGHLTQDERVKQVRWVVKASDEASGKTGLSAVEDDTLARQLPVPAGFRMDVDAAPDEDPDQDGNDLTLGKQEMDKLDPERMNIGWTWERDEDGNLLYNKDKKPKLTYKSPMPSTVTDNAAHIKAGGSTQFTLHVNHFAQLTARYDDTKFAASDEARAGYYRDKEHPYLGIEMEQMYFNGDPFDKFSWEPGRPTLDTTVSRMMKYRITLKNLSTKQLEDLGVTGTGDTCTNPDISAMLPYISALPTSGKGFTYVPHSEMLADPTCVLRDDFETVAKQNDQGVTVEYATNINDETPLWTYYVAGENTADNPYAPTLQSTEVGSDSVRMAQQLGPDVKHNRQYLSMHFGGPQIVDGKPTGRLNSGQELVVEFMMPIREDAGGVTSSNLMDAAGFVHKAGNYTPYIPTEQTSYDTTSFETDTRDSNLDGSTSQLILVRNLSGLGFEDSEAFLDIKTSTTQVDSLFTKNVNGAAAAPEGTDFSYSIQTSNQNSKAAQALNYIWPVMYDILPYEGDVEASNRTDGKPIPRNSGWNAWLTDLGLSEQGEPDGTSPAIEVVLNDPATAEQFPDGKPLEPAQYELWVGPFVKEADGTVRAAEMDALPKMYEVPKPEIPAWVRERRDNKGDVMHKEGFVTLKELQTYVKAHPDEEEALRKNVRAIWCTVKDKDVHLPANGSLELRYHLHTPLNLPKYLGDTTKSAPTDDEKQQPLYQRMVETSQWNSFFHFVNRNGVTDTLDSNGELSQAGVMVDAPEGRGYIGDYVWLDADWSGAADDTVNGAADYRASENGRRLLAGVGEDGKPFASAGKLKDLDGDGEPDDPGINGVRVELLNEHGLPVNRDGKVAKFTAGAGADGQDLWLECDPETGEPIKDAMGSFVVAEAGGPLAFTTESDYYGNEGYYILSNLAVEDGAGKPMRYRLRLTFPEAYAGYAVTTTTIGDGVPVEFGTREVDGERRLVATTGDIEPTAVAYDKDKFANGQDDPVHAAHDAAAVSHDVGIALPVPYTGVAYRDDVLEGGGAAEPIDGYLDSQIDPAQGGEPAGKPEQRLANATVEAHEFDPATQQISKDPALDAFGKPAVATAGADGAFGFTLKPHRHYVLTSTVAGALVKPTPYLWSQDPAAKARDNDLYSLHGQALTHPFEALPPRTADGRPDYVAPGDPSSGYRAQDAFALGYVDGTIGFIGDTVWEDADHDGVQDAGEPGVEGLEVTLEQYWWDASAKDGAGAWRLNEDEPTRTAATNAAGTYVFKTATARELPPSADDPDAPPTFALAGYRVRIDRDDLDALGHAAFATRRRAGSDTELDSDMARGAVDAATGEQKRAYYLTDEGGQLIVAAPAGTGTAPENTASGPGGEEYDLVSGETIADADAGLVRVPTASIDGVVWEDADRDGLQDLSGDAPDDKPLPGQTVTVEQYYLDGKTWVRNDEFGEDAYTAGIVTGGTAKDGKVSVQTGTDGAYLFDNLPTAYAAPGAEEPRLAGYRLTLAALADDHTLTRYHASMPGRPDFDTTRVDSDVYSSGLEIVDRDSFDAGDNRAGERPNDGQVLLAARAGDDALYGATDPATGSYDAVAAGPARVRGGDVGQELVSAAAVRGRIWQDLDNDGVQDGADVWVDADDDGQVDGGEMRPEAGVPGIEVELTRYIADPGAADGWTPDPTFGTDGALTATTADDGSYSFERLEATRRDDATGAFTVYGYRVALVDPEAVEESWHVARYQQGDDPALDSDLVLGTGSMVDADASEYLVLLEPATDETAEMNRVEAPAALPEPGQGTVTYDATAPRGEGTHDGGLLPRAAHDIAGHLWHDADYDGVREAGERGLAEKEVTLHRWVLRDGAWRPCPEALAGGPTERALTDADGRFAFEDEPAAVRENGAELLMGYTVTVLGTDAESDVDHGVAGLPVTAVQVGSPAMDAVNSKARRPQASGGDVEIAWDERDEASGQRRTLDGKVVLAAPAREDSHPAYTVGAFDVSYGAGETRMNAGFGPFPTASLSGIVWDDAHYDGIQQLEGADAPERGMPGVRVRITQWYLDDQGSFVQNEDFGDGERHALEAVTDEDGAYSFEGLPTHVQMKDGRPARPEERGGDDFRLAAYRVSLPEVPEGYAVTRYHAGDDPTADSDLESSERVGDLDIVEVHADQTPEGEVLRGDGFAIVAEPVGEPDTPSARTAYEAMYGKAAYDALRPRGLTRGGDAGLVQIDADAAIDGTAWIDADADGIRAAREKGLPGVSVTLTRYMRAVGPDAAGWTYDAEFEPRRAQTGADGAYRFDGLPSSGQAVLDGALARVLYGYRVNVDGIPAGYAVAAPGAGEDAALDSDLDMATTRLVPDEATAGLTVLAEAWEPGEDKGMRLPMGKLGAFTAARSRDAHHLDAGLVPQGTTRVAGLVWEDANRDGLQTPGEYLRVGQRVMLDRRLMTDDELEAAGFGSRTSDGAPGSALDDAGEPVVPAKPGEPVLPEGGASAPEADLPRLEDDGILSDGAWEQVATSATDLTGHYAFEDLPVADGAGRPYAYRVRMIKPEGAEYVPHDVDNGRDDADARDNDYAHLNVSGTLTPEEVGVTGALATMAAYGRPNAYGQPWDLGAATPWDREHGNSVDLAVYVPPAEQDPSLPGPVDRVLSGLLPQTGDETRLVRAVAIGAAGVALLLVALAVRERRRRAE